MMATQQRLNGLLAALSAADMQCLFPHLEWLEFQRGEHLHEAGVPLRHVHFPVTAIVSLTSTMRNGATAELAVVGHEGMVGVGAFMGGGPSLDSAVVHTGGWGWRMPAAALDGAARTGASLMQVLLRYARSLFTQVAQISACGRHHSLDEQLCRWLLLHLDRVEGNEFFATHESIAQGLGMRREGVTEGALKLRDAGLIRYARGHMAILDRAGLHARSCECYDLMLGTSAGALQVRP